MCVFLNLFTLACFLSVNNCLPRELAEGSEVVGLMLFSTAQVIVNRHHYVIQRVMVLSGARPVYYCIHNTISYFSFSYRSAIILGHPCVVEKVDKVIETYLILTKTFTGF